MNRAMNLDYAPEEEAFRTEVRQFLTAELPPQLSARVKARKALGKQDMLGWQRILHARGWGAPAWPVEAGGTGWNAVRQSIFDEECRAAGAPMQIAFGLMMVAPVIMKFGTPAQKRQHLGGIIDGTVWWSQGYSEPGAGSDLASLKTSAVRDGDHYVVNGQKTWTTLAQHGDWIFCLVRTNSEGRKQEGISFLLIDLTTPGVSVRPLLLLSGEHEVNEVFFDAVRVPVENLVGEENKGWNCAKYLLGFERTLTATVGAAKAELQRLKQVARALPGSDGRRLIEDARFRDRIAQVELEIMALDVMNLRFILAQGKQMTPGPEASILKLRGSEIRQSLSELSMLALGPEALPHLRDGPPTDEACLTYLETLGGAHAASTASYFNFRKTTIYGGSSEVQRNIIAKHILNL